MRDAPACPSCGAALPPDAERCDLCGIELDANAAALMPEPVDATAEATQPLPAAQAVGLPEAASSSAPLRCTTCGHVNPPWSRFCNQCAAPLAAVAATAGPEAASPAVIPPVAVPVVEPALPGAVAGGERPPSDPGRRALLIVGIGIAAVVALYFVTQASQGPPASESEATAATGDAPRLTPAPVALPDSLRAQVARLEDEGTAQSLDDAGGLLYRVAAGLPPEDPQRAALAQQAVDLYDRSLALQDDPDVRVNLAVAALLDGRNPMRTVQELQAVLTQDPDHVEANFNMGLMRMQIGRLEEAAASFQKVIALSPPGGPMHQRATEALAAVEGALRQPGASG